MRPQLLGIFWNSDVKIRWLAMVIILVVGGRRRCEMARSGESGAVGSPAIDKR